MTRRVWAVRFAAVSVASLLAAATLQAADDGQPGQKAAGAKQDSLEEVVITGSLIPRPKEETAVPTSTITAEDLRTKGFATVADALQQASFSNGSVQGAQFVNGFTPGCTDTEPIWPLAQLRQVPHRRAPDGRLSGAVQRHGYHHEHQRHPRGDGRSH